MKNPIAENAIKLYILFIISAFVGWLYEIVTVCILYDRYIDRGILHLPLCPIYGVGMLLLYIFLHKQKNVFAIFGISAAITTSIELIASYAIEYFFHYYLWTYEGWPLSFQNRISLISSIIFGLMAVLVFKAVVPAVNKIYSDNRIAVNITVCAITVFMIFAQVAGMNADTEWII